MRAIVYDRPGAPDVLHLTDRPVPEPGEGEVRVRLARAGVNPTDWKSRSKAQPGPEGQVPGQDGAGIVEAVGAGVDPALVGERVWVWEAAYGRPYGTAAEYTVVPGGPGRPPARRRPVRARGGAGHPVPHGAPLPHRRRDRARPTWHPGRWPAARCWCRAARERSGNAAIQLARWAGATVISHGQRPGEGALATAAGAHHVVDYRSQDVVAEVRQDRAGRRRRDRGGRRRPRTPPPTRRCSRRFGAVAIYADDGGPEVTVPVRAADGR